MTPIERAARTLCKLDGHCEDGEREGKPLWRSYLPQALAVVEALHEPNKLMREGGAGMLRAMNPDYSQLAAEDDAANVWRLMVDAMRKDI